MATLRLGIDASKAKAGADQFTKATDKITDGANRASTATDRLGSSSTKAGNSAKRFSGGLSKLGNVSGQTRSKIQNTSFQLQDIVVQLQGGTKASTALAQQLPQLLGGFGALGAVLGVVAGLGIPAVAFAFSSLKGETVDTEAALDNFSSALQLASDFASIAQAPIQDLQKKYGALAKQIQETSAIAAQSELSKAMLQFKGVANGLKTPLEQLTHLFGVLKTARAELAELPEETGNEFGSQIALRNVEIKETTEQIIELAAAMGMSQSQAAKFSIGLEELEKAKGFKNISVEAGELLELLSGTVSEAGKVPEVLIPIVDKLRELQTAAASGAVAVEALGGAFTTLPMTTGTLLQIPEGGVAALMPGFKKPSRGSGASRINSELKELENFAKKFKPLITLSQEYKNNLDKLNEARQRGAITEQEHAQAVAVATQQFQIGTGALVDYDSVANNFATTLGNNLMALVDGTMSVKDAFKSLATQVIKELYRVLVVQQIVNAAMGAFGYSPAVGGGFTKTPITTVSAFGGPVGAGNGMVVGERGPEVFYPQSRGTIVPNNQAGGNVVVNQTFQFAANGDESVKKIIAESAPQIAKLTERSIMDQRRRGGQMKAVFG